MTELAGDERGFIGFGHALKLSENRKTLLAYCCVAVEWLVSKVRNAWLFDPARQYVVTIAKANCWSFISGAGAFSW